MVSKTISPLNVRRVVLFGIGPTVGRNRGGKFSHMPQKLTDEIIDAAIEGFEAQKVRLDQKIAELRAMRSGDHHQDTSTTAPEAAPRKRRKFSAAAIKRMREAQKQRWAKVRGQSEPVQAAAPPTKPKRKLSAATRARLVANLKKARAAKAAKAKAVGK